MGRGAAGGGGGEGRCGAGVEGGGAGGREEGVEVRGDGVVEGGAGEAQEGGEGVGVEAECGRETRGRWRSGHGEGWWARSLEAGTTRRWRWRW